jgi:NADH:ubiquinone oxidoreductase subunit K
MSIHLHFFLLLSLLIFTIGIYGVLIRRNLIGILIGVELMLNAASLNFLAFNRYVVTDPAVGQIIVLFIIGLAAAEAAILLSIILRVYRSHRNIDADSLTEMRGR